MKQAEQVGNHHDELAELVEGLELDEGYQVQKMSPTAFVSNS